MKQGRGKSFVRIRQHSAQRKTPKPHAGPDGDRRQAWSRCIPAREGLRERILARIARASRSGGRAARAIMLVFWAAPPVVPVARAFLRLRTRSRRMAHISGPGTAKARPPGRRQHRHRPRPAHALQGQEGCPIVDLASTRRAKNHLGQPARTFMNVPWDRLGRAVRAGSRGTRVGFRELCSIPRC